MTKTNKNFENQKKNRKAALNESLNSKNHMKIYFNAWTEILKNKKIRSGLYEGQVKVIFFSQKAFHFAFIINLTRVIRTISKDT